MCADIKKTVLQSAFTRRLLLWLAPSLPIALAIIFWPTINALAWHGLHENPFKFRGREFLIPNTWVVSSADNAEITLVKHPPSIFSKKPYQFMSFEQEITKGEPGTINFESWGRALAMQYENSKYQVIGPERIDRQSRSFCVSASPLQLKDAIEISCWLDEGSWQAHYMGTKVDALRFREVISNLK